MDHDSELEADPERSIFDMLCMVAAEQRKALLWNPKSGQFELVDWSENEKAKQSSADHG